MCHKKNMLKCVLCLIVNFGDILFIQLTRFIKNNRLSFDFPFHFSTFAKKNKQALCYQFQTFQFNLASVSFLMK